MNLEKLSRPTPLYRVTTKRHYGQWTHSRTMAYLWFVTTYCHNASMRRFNNRTLKAKCIAERPKVEVPWLMIIVGALWLSITALVTWFIWNL